MTLFIITRKQLHISFNLINKKLCITMFIKKDEILIIETLIKICKEEKA